MKKVLFISTSIPPHFESQTIRNAFFLKRLINDGFAVTVVTTQPSKIDNTLSDICFSFHYNTIHIGEPWYPKFSSRLNHYSRTAAKVIGYLAGLFLYPDLTKGLSSKILKNKKVQDEAKSTDVIISSSGSYEAHRAATHLSVKYKKPLICELGDPWAYNPIWPENFVLKKLFNTRLEKECLNQASLATFTTQQTSNFYGAKYKHLRIETIPMGFSDSDFQDVSTISPPSEFQSITYVGVAYRGSRDITPLLRALKGLSLYDLKFNVYGYTSSYFNTYAAKNNLKSTKFHGPVNYKDSIKLIKKNTLLLLLGNDGRLQIPGKAYMYLATHNPILYLGQIPCNDDPTWQLLKKFDGVIHADAKNYADVQSKLSKIMSDWRELSEISKRRVQSEELSAYEWNNNGKRFSNAVKRTISEGKMRNED